SYNRAAPSPAARRHAKYAPHWRFQSATILCYGRHASIEHGGPVKRWSLEELAREPRWPLERTMALPGQVRGNALRSWGVHVRNRFGATAADKVRDTLG